MFRHSIRTKLILLLLIATVVPICTSMIISYYYTKNTVTQDMIRDTQANLSLGKLNLLNYMNAVNQSSLLIYTGINRAGSLYTQIENIALLDTDASGVPRRPPMPSDALRSDMLNMLRSVKEFYKVHLYTEKDQYSYLQVNDFHRSRFNPDYEPVTAAGPYIEPPHLSHNFQMGNVLPYREDDKVMTFHRPIIRTPTDEILGYLSIDIRMELIEAIGEQMVTKGEDTFYILNRDSRIMYGPDEQGWGQAYDGALLQQIYDSGKDEGYFNWSQENFKGYVFYQTIQTLYMDWVIMKLIPYEQLEQSARGITKINSLLFGSFLVVAVLLTMYITIRFTRTIKKLMGYVQKIQTGNLQVDIDINDKDELGLLAQRFRSMMQTINELIVREYKLQIANTTNQLKALQAQINPHFMYNALQSIATLALQNKDEKMYSLITSLGKMMRYSMRTHDTTVELKQELDYLVAYLKLQKQRFDDSFEYQLNIGESTAGIPVPKMILQPIVENYFKHGYVKREEMAQISISTSLQEDILEIRVIDNGMGMTKEQLDLLHERLTPGADEFSSANHEHIGLHNVLTRLTLQYTAATLAVEQHEPYGLKVILRIPAHHEANSQEESDENHHR
jgi:two-component system sensor histidine kinase YesM